MKNDPRFTSGVESGVPLPDPVGFWRRRALVWHGCIDRWTLRDEVKDGQHTHLSRWLEARTNHGIALVDRWERRVLAPIERRLAQLPPSLAVEPVIDPGPPGEDPRERVEWTARRREAEAVEARNAQAADEYRRSLEERRIHEADHLNVRLAAAEARQQWVAAYDQSSTVYARRRIARRGMRPAPAALVPPYEPLDARHRQETDASGVHQAALAPREGVV